MPFALSPLLFALSIYLFVCFFFCVFNSDFLLCTTLFSLFDFFLHFFLVPLNSSEGVSKIV
uniref:Uncharacterized protein n=1 Tax=Rhizophora mucronata TaxID=61149 RepID=A0A2P2MQZ0_RHIMU